MTSAPTVYQHTSCVKGLLVQGALCPQCRLTLTAALTSGQWLVLSSLGLGAGSPQCLLRQTVMAVPASDQCTHTHTRLVRFTVSGQVGGLLDWSRQVPLQPGHMSLELTISKPYPTFCCMLQAFSCLPLSPILSFSSPSLLLAQGSLLLFSSSHIAPVQTG